MIFKPKIKRNVYKRVVGFRWCLLVTGEAYAIFMNCTGLLTIFTWNIYKTVSLEHQLSINWFYRHSSKTVWVSGTRWFEINNIFVINQPILHVNEWIEAGSEKKNLWL